MNRIFYTQELPAVGRWFADAVRFLFEMTASFVAFLVFELRDSNFVSPMRSIALGFPPADAEFVPHAFQLLRQETRATIYQKSKPNRTLNGSRQRISIKTKLPCKRSGHSETAISGSLEFYSNKPT